MRQGDLQLCVVSRGPCDDWQDTWLATQPRPWANCWCLEGHVAGGTHGCSGAWLEWRMAVVPAMAGKAQGRRGTWLAGLEATIEKCAFWSREHSTCSSRTHLVHVTLKGKSASAHKHKAVTSTCTRTQTIRAQTHVTHAHTCSHSLSDPFTNTHTHTCTAHTNTHTRTCSSVRRPPTSLCRCAATSAAASASCCATIDRRSTTTLATSACSDRMHSHNLSVCNSALERRCMGVTSRWFCKAAQAR